MWQFGNIGGEEGHPNAIASVESCGDLFHEARDTSPSKRPSREADSNHCHTLGCCDVNPILGPIPHTPDWRVI